jgi:predicted nucleic acid-binding protein
MIIYPDSCIYGRPQDDQTQLEIEKETLAIAGVIRICKLAGHVFMGSAQVESEILANSNAMDRKAAWMNFKSIAKYSVNLTAEDFRRARELEAQGLDEGDSFHLAAAEAAGVDVLLTVDKDFERIVTIKNLSKVRVLNPFKLLQEVT